MLMCDGSELKLLILLVDVFGENDLVGDKLGVNEGLELTLGLMLGADLGEIVFDGILLARTVGSVLGFELGMKVGVSVGALVGRKIQVDGVVTVICVIQDASFPALSIAVTVTSCTDCTSVMVKEDPPGGYCVLCNVLQSYATKASVNDGTIFGTALCGHEVKLTFLAGGQTIISGGVVSIALSNV